jgi:hypothetical protein
MARVGSRKTAEEKELLGTTCPRGEKAVEKSQRLEKIHIELCSQNEVTRTYIESP